MIPMEQIILVRKLDDRNSKLINLVVSTIGLFANKNGVPFFEFQDTVSYDDVPTLLVSVGGDGTMLFTSKISLTFTKSYVLGVTAGNLGFLTDEFSGIAEFTNVLHALMYPSKENKLLKLDKRNILHCEHIGNDGSTKTAIAINEFLVTASNNHAPIDYSIRVNEQFLAEQKGTGIMVASATGSTAYSLSAGGAIMHPTTSAMQIVPVSTHSLTARPVILSGVRDFVTISVPVTERIGGVELHVDGQVQMKYTRKCDNFSIRIRNHDRVVKIVRPNNWSFFETLSHKLGWN